MQANKQAGFFLWETILLSIVLLAMTAATGMYMRAAQLQSVSAVEGRADYLARAQISYAQAVLDKLCQLELDGFKRENDNLRSQLNMATLRESQTAQNAFIQQGFSNEVDQLYNRLNNCPVPSTPVYGRTPIFTCNNGGCGCGCNGGSF